MHRILKAIDAINRNVTNHDFPSVFARNRKNGKLYKVLATATCATNGQENAQMVVYLSATNELFVREITEFEDKFEFLTPGKESGELS